jgi:hypothetical protein
MGVVYYIDNVNGTDARSGLREPTTSHNHVDSSAADTSTVCAALLSAVNDYYNGATLWNRTRGAGAIVSDYDGASKTLTHGAIAGHVATDEFYLVNAWKTMSKATTTCAVGDIAYYRAGQTETLAAAIAFTNDGTVAAYISIIGMGTGSTTLETTDETATEAWHDASTARPIIDENNSSYYCEYSGDDFWKIQNLRITNARSSVGLLRILRSCGTLISNCVIDNNSTNMGMLIQGSQFTLENCSISNVTDYGIKIYDSSIGYITDCTINGGGYNPTVGIYLADGCVMYLNNCNIGNINTFSTADIQFINSSYLNSGVGYAKNCKFNSAIKTDIPTQSQISQLFEEDAGQVYGAHIATGYLGVAERVTDVVRTGGATSSVKIIPTTYVGLLRPFILQDFPKPTWQVWCPTGTQTITVYIRGLNWASYPTAAQLYLGAEYVTDDTTGAITRSTVVSDEVLTDNTTWVGLQCAVNPHVAGFVNLKLYLGLYEDASTGIYVDIKPVVT